MRSRRSSRAQIDPSSSRSPDTYARARPSSPGAVRIRRRASGERITIVAGASTGPDRLPSYASTARGRPPPSTSSTKAANAITPPPALQVPTRLGHALVERQRDDPRRHLGAAHVDDHLALLPHLRREERQRDPAVE